VVGTIGAGKTHFLASALTEAYHDQSLSEYGYTEFFPDTSTARRFEAELYESVSMPQMPAGSTESENFDHRPLSFRVSYQKTTQAALLIHNIPGEALMDQSKRAELLPFLRSAHGIIFLIDPKFLPKFRGLVPPDRAPSKSENGDDELSGFHQTRLVIECLSEWKAQKGSESETPYISIVISKSDVLPQLLEQSFAFATNGPSVSDTKAWNEDRKKVVAEVRDVLERCGSRDLLVFADQSRGTVFQAVAPTGVELRSGSKAKFVPKRCTEVLAAALDGIMKVGRRNWSI
jgi:hypothetical protein